MATARGVLIWLPLWSVQTLRRQPGGQKLFNEAYCRDYALQRLQLELAETPPTFLDTFDNLQKWATFYGELTPESHLFLNSYLILARAVALKNEKAFLHFSKFCQSIPSEVLNAAVLSQVPVIQARALASDWLPWNLKNIMPQLPRQKWLQEILLQQLSRYTDFRGSFYGWLLAYLGLARGQPDDWDCLRGNVFRIVADELPEKAERLKALLPSSGSCKTVLEGILSHLRVLQKEDLLAVDYSPARIVSIGLENLCPHLLCDFSMEVLRPVLDRHSSFFLLADPARARAAAAEMLALDLPFHPQYRARLLLLLGRAPEAPRPPEVSELEEQRTIAEYHFYDYMLLTGSSIYDPLNYMRMAAKLEPTTRVNQQSLVAAAARGQLWRCQDIPGFERLFRPQSQDDPYVLENFGIGGEVKIHQYQDGVDSIEMYRARRKYGRHLHSAPDVNCVSPKVIRKLERRYGRTFRNREQALAGGQQVEEKYARNLKLLTSENPGPENGPGPGSAPLVAPRAAPELAPVRPGPHLG